MVDPVAIPNGLKHAVRETEHQQVLHRFFAEKMINAVNLRFLPEHSKAAD